MTQRRNWTREELIVALNLYCKIPFKDSHSYHPMVMEYAQLIGRSPSAMNLKIGNLGRLDPTLKNKNITGLINGSKLDVVVWNEFHDNPEALAYESERIIAAYRNQSVEQSSGIDIVNLPLGKEREAIVRQRVNQQFFRASVLAAYNATCCVSGVSINTLVEACHISPWAQDVKNRTNPCNGLCLNSFFHKAFDNWLFAITPDLLIDIKEELIDTTTESSTRDYLYVLCGRQMIMPERFTPDTQLLQEHYEQYISQ